MPIYTNDHHDGCIPPFRSPLFSSIGIGPKVTKAIDDATRKWLDDHPEATTTVEDESLEERKLKPSFSLELCRCFDTATDMQAATDLKAGMTCHTNGFYSVGDGGAAFYKVIEDDEPNGMDVLVLQSDLKAKIVVNDDSVNIAQLGAKADNDEDCYPYIVQALSLAKTVSIGDGIYTLKQSVVVPSNRNIIGITELNNYGYGAIIQTVGYDISAFVVNTSDVLLKNINIVHSYDQDEDTPVIDLSGSRYVHLENVIISKDSNSQTSDCIAVYCNPTSSDWSGYITLNNVRASRYKHSLYAKSTLLTCYNCVFNSDTEENLHLEGEVFTFVGCDISGSGLALTYDGLYGVKFVGCYFEGFYAPFYTSTKNSEIIFESCKYYISTPNAISKAFVVNDTNFNGSDIRGYDNGFHNITNLVKNGAFDNSTRWVAGYTLNTDGDVPVGYKNSITGSTYQDLGLSLPNGVYTLSYWVKFDAPITSGRLSMWLTNGTGSGARELEGRRFTSNVQPEVGKWIKVICPITISDAAIYNYHIVRLYATVDVGYKITGVSLYRGYHTEEDIYGNSCNEKTVQTDSLVLKGSDGVYYKINVSGGVITATGL